MVKEDLIKRKLKTDLQRYVFKAIPHGFSSTSSIKHRGLISYVKFMSRGKFGVTRQNNSPKSPTIHPAYLQITI
jgi:hypothetical protein